jgi:hypothetical protein
MVGEFRPDWVLQIDDSTPLVHLGLEDLDVPRAWYAVDSHLHSGWHPHYAALFDHVFCAQKNRLADLGRFQTEVTWLPPHFSDARPFLPWTERIHDASFVGTLDPALNPARCALVEALLARGLRLNCKRGSYLSEYPVSRIVFNQSVQDDLNFRCFEAMGCGALLITDRISHSLEELGEPGRDFLVYAPGDIGELAARIEWALGHPAEAEAIARRGHARIVERHLGAHRVATLIAALTNAARKTSREPPAPPGDSRQAREAHEAARVRGHLAFAHEHVSRLSLPPPLGAFFAAQADRLAHAALAAAPGTPWAGLTLALRGLATGDHGPALAALESIRAAPADSEYRRRYAFASSLLLAHAGRMVEARRAAADGMVAFPDDADLGRILKALLGSSRG